MNYKRPEATLKHNSTLFTIKLYVLHSSLPRNDAISLNFYDRLSLCMSVSVCLSVSLFDRQTVDRLTDWLTEVGASPLTSFSLASVL